MHGVDEGFGPLRPLRILPLSRHLDEQYFRVFTRGDAGRPSPQTVQALTSLSPQHPVSQAI
jgi:hypothetical protein